MATTETIPCQHCREGLRADEVLNFCGHLLCEPCFDEALRALRVAEALKGAGFSKPRAA